MTDDNIEPQSFPITLMRVFFTRSAIMAVPQHTPGAQFSITPENKIDVTRVGEESHYVATMQTSFNQACDPSAPYVIDIECVGIFSTALPMEEAVRGITITAHNVLYGAIREAVSWITGRHVYGTLTFGLSILKPKRPDKEE